jgi:hypothetical protein
MVAWSKFAFAGLQEVRIIYKQDALDISAVDKDLELEWKCLYSNLRYSSSYLQDIFGS